ncbi:MAG: hypothetical protein HOV80_09875 [Polyangiaceae bacterium]|nr:hypothetical protein [Polyangiaceae bacterium]
MRASLTVVLISSGLAILSCTDPTGVAPTATSSASAASTGCRFPPSVGVIRTDAQAGKPELPTSTDRGCTEAPASIDDRRLLSAELGVANPVAATPPVTAGFFLVRNPEVVPEPGTTTVPGLFLTIETGPRGTSSAPFALRARWDNRVDKPRVVMRPAHGSFSDWRAPSWHVMARDLSTKRIYRYDYPDEQSCTGVAQITNDHYVTVPGGSEVPKAAEWEYGAGPLPTSGKIEVWLVYRFCGHTDAKAFIGYSNESDVLRTDVDKGLVASNSIVIDLGATGAR